MEFIYILVGLFFLYKIKETLKAHHNLEFQRQEALRNAELELQKEKLAEQKEKQEELESKLEKIANIKIKTDDETTIFIDFNNMNYEYRYGGMYTISKKYLLRRTSENSWTMALMEYGEWGLSNGVLYVQNSIINMANLAKNRSPSFMGKSPEEQVQEELGKLQEEINENPITGALANLLTLEWNKYVSERDKLLRNSKVS